MSNNLPSRNPETRKNCLSTHYFVGLFIPFIISINLIKIPFVFKIRPNNPLRPIGKQIEGFSLIELVVTMAVAAILVTIAVPTMRTAIQNGRLNTQANDLIGDLNFARSEAIKRRSNVGICRSTDGITFAGAGPLGDGRVVFVDVNNNNACEAGDTILRFREPLASGNTLVAVPSNPIIFSSNGSPAGPAVGAFAVCDYRGIANGKRVTLNGMGQATVGTTAPGAC